MGVVADTGAANALVVNDRTKAADNCPVAGDALLAGPGRGHGPWVTS
jgi:hypothetical protein